MESGELMEEGGARGCSMISWARGHVLVKVLGTCASDETECGSNWSFLARNFLPSDVGLFLVSEEVAFDLDRLSRASSFMERACVISVFGSWWTCSVRDYAETVVMVTDNRGPCCKLRAPEKKKLGSTGNQPM